MGWGQVVAGRWVIGVAVVVLVFGGCGGDDGTEAGAGASSAISTATTTTTVPPPVRLTIEEAAAAYLAIVEPYNVALEGLELAVNGGQPLGVLQEKASATATANVAHIEALRGTLWPVDVQPAVDDLVAESEQAQASWVQAAQAQSVQALVDAVIAAGEHDGADAAATIRELLDLDAYDEDDYTP